jgi:hypothetical protein|tara:strand:- start:10349 stop:10582 length:234 start_codon:yes stop_codon:yes gene_type:complete
MGLQPGRKTAVEEAVRDKAVNVAWGLVLEYLADGRVPRNKRVEIATKLAVKNIPQDVTTGGQSFNISFDERLKDVVA